jgi:hypothetical protein
MVMGSCLETITTEKDIWAQTHVSCARLIVRGTWLEPLCHHGPKVPQFEWVCGRAGKFTIPGTLIMSYLFTGCC